MKKLVVLFMFLTVIVFSAFGYANSNYKETTLTELSSGKAVTLTSGSMLVIKLPANPSTGFCWKVKGVNSQILKNVSKSESASNGPEYTYDSNSLYNGKPIPGAQATQVLRFVGESSGKTLLKISYERPWEKKSPEKTYSVNVQSMGKFTGQYYPPQKNYTYVAPPADEVKTPALPAHYDCRDYGWVPSVRDQGSAGTCWAFGTVAVFESKIMKKEGVERDLSEQFVVSCNPWGMSTAGGWWGHPLHYNYVASGEMEAGDVYESDFPYSATDESPNGPYPHHEQIEGWGYIDGVADECWPLKTHSSTTAEIKQAIYDHGPIGTAVGCNNWGSYTGGVLTTSSTPSNHIVLITGWDDTDGCFYIKNSWGTSFGENGYIRLAYGISEVGDGATYVNYEKTNPRLVYSGDNFYEAPENNGAIYNYLTLNLLDAGSGYFAVTNGYMTQGTDYLVANVPSGLTVNVQGTSSTTAKVTLSGNAYSHANAYDISNLTITFLDAAFSGITAAGVEGSSNSTLIVDFYDPFNIVYEDINPDLTVNTTNTWEPINFGSNGQMTGGLWYYPYNTAWPQDPNNYRFKLETYSKPALCNGTTMPGELIPLSYGTEIGPNSQYWCPGGTYGDQHTITGPAYTSWNGQSAYVGAKYTLNGWPIYVWFHIQVSSDGQSVTLLDLAYNEDPLGTIAAGQTQGGGNQSPVANVNGPYTGTVGTTVSFSSAGSSDPDGSISSYSWNFGDGNTSTQANPSHSYTAAGTFTVTLTVTDNQGATGSAQATATITSGSSQYCSSNGNSTQYEWISQVQVGSFTNSSGASSAGYSDFTSQTFDVSKGSSYNVTLTPGFSGSAYTEYWAIWIDYNHNSSFDDSGELVYSGSGMGASGMMAGAERDQRSGVNSARDTENGIFPVESMRDILVKFEGSLKNNAITVLDEPVGSSGLSNASGSITIPSSALSGNTRMRVSMHYNSAPPSCGSFDYGEVEDYTVNIIGGGTNQPPVANANGPYKGSVSSAVSFSSSGSNDPDGSISSYSWDFGDGNTSTQANPSHSYSTANTYTVTLTVTDNDGASGSNQTTATISSSQNQPPVANANGPYNGSVGSAVSFSSSGSNDPDGSISSYSWDFGDGSTSTQANPSHSYTAAGTFTVTLTVTDNQGATGSNQTTATITGSGPNPIPLPYTEGFESGLGNWSQATGDDMDWTRHSGSTPSSSTGPSSAASGSYYVYTEASSNYPSKVANLVSDYFVLSGVSNPSVTFSYHMYGSAMGTLKLQVSTNNGSSWTTLWSMSGDQGNSWNSATVSLASYTSSSSVILRFNGTIGSSYRSDMAIDDVTIGGVGGNQPPVANANGPYNGSVGSAVSFSSSGSNDPDGSISSYSWNFGDGNTSTQANPSHSYTAAGTFTVTLTVTDNQGATGSNPTTATITGGGGYITSESEPNDNSNSADGPVGFGVNVSGGINTSSESDWYYFDANSAGSVNISFNISSNCGVAWLLYRSSDLNNYVAYGSRNGDQVNGSYNVPSAGRYYINIYHYGGGLYGYVLSVTGGGSANQPPVAKANGPYSGTVGSSISFSSSGSDDPDGSISSYSWDFGDGDNSTQTSPSHSYSSAGTYTVTLTVTDDDGDDDSDAVTATVTEGGGGGWIQLTYDDFENGWGNYSDGGSDCKLYTGGSYAHQGSNAADIQDNSSTSSSFYYSNGIDVHYPNYTQIEIDFWFRGVSMENNEDFWVQYYDGSTWNTIASYVRGTDFNNNTFYHETVYVNETDYTFPTNMKIRFRCDASGNSDDVYIDEVKVSARSGSTMPAENKKISESITIPDGYVLYPAYPNPFNPETNISIELPKDETVYLRIHDSLGRLVRTVIAGEVLKAGRYTYCWDGCNNVGQVVPSGLYIVQMKAGTFNALQKVMFLK